MAGPVQTNIDSNVNRFENNYPNEFRFGDYTVSIPVLSHVQQPATIATAELFPVLQANSVGVSLVGYPATTTTITKRRQRQKTIGICIL